MDKQNTGEDSVLATHRDPSLRRDRSLREAAHTRKSKAAGRGIEWVTPTELTMRGASRLLRTSSMLNVSVHKGVRKRIATAARPATERAQRLAPALSFGRSRRRGGRDGVAF